MILRELTGDKDPRKYLRNYNYTGRVNSQSQSRLIKTPCINVTTNNFSAPSHATLKREEMVESQYLKKDTKLRYLSELMSGDFDIRFTNTCTPRIDEYTTFP